MKAKTRIALLISAFFLPFAAGAQLVVNGEFRPRAEYRHGFKAPAGEDMDAAFLITQRSRLNMGFTDGKVKTGLSIQDIRIWGDTPQLNTSDLNLSVHEAWAEYSFTPQLSLKAGRMELVYDDARILGNVDWAQQGRSHDIALLKYEGNFKIHAGFAFNQNEDKLSSTIYTMAGNYKTMQLLWANKKWENLNLSLLFMNTGKQSILMETEGIKETNTHFAQTFGATATYLANPLTFNASIYKQSGEEVTSLYAPGIALDAIMAAFSVRWAVNGTFSLTPGFEYLSGTSQFDASAHDFNKIRSFNPLFGTNHKFNGSMDYFYVGNHINSVGLQDLYLKANYARDRFSGGADLHFFSAAADLISSTNAVEKGDKNLGQELDLYIGYKLASNVTLTAGYSQYFTTESIVNLRGGSNDATSNWAWISLTFKPQFLNTGK